MDSKPAPHLCPTAHCALARRVGIAAPRLWCPVTTAAGQTRDPSLDPLHQPVFADEIILNPAMQAGQAFQAIGFSCLRHFAANQDAVTHCDPEGLHQMRVGLRRFRAAMSFFKHLIEQPDSDNLKRGLRWLTEQLGPARDLDVLLNESLKPLQQQEPEARELRTLENDLEDRRRAAFARSKAAVESERYHIGSWQHSHFGASRSIASSGGIRFSSCRNVEIIGGSLFRANRLPSRRVPNLQGREGKLAALAPTSQPNIN